MTDVTIRPEQRRPAPSYAGVGMSNTGSGGLLVPQNFGEVVAFATVMARSGIALPKHLRDNDGACLAVAMQAMRWEMDPWAVANKSYSVNDRLAYEAQLVAAVVHTRAPIKRRPDYEYDGAGPTRRCIVSVEMLDGSTKVYETPTFAAITTKNSPLWKADPDQQLGYFAIRSWARRHTPEVILGVYTPDELIDNPAVVRNVTPPPGLAARLQAAGNSGEGFSAAHAERRPSVVDSETGEVTDGLCGDDITPQFTAPAAAEEEAGEAEEEDAAPADDFPGDKPKAGPTLAERTEAFRGRCLEARTTLKLKALYGNAGTLRADLDAADPESAAEVENWYRARLDEVGAAEDEARKAGQ